MSSVVEPHLRRRLLSPRRVLWLAVVLLMLIGTVMGYSYERRRYAALAYARQAGGGIQQFPTWARGQMCPPWLAEVRAVVMRDAHCDLRRITAFGEARQLLLTRCTLDRGGLGALRQFPRLEELWLERTNVTDDDLAVIAIECPQLSRICLNSTAVTDAGVESLAKLPLTRLDLSGTRITDEGLRHLSGDRLSVLDLDGTDVTDAGLEHLAGLPLVSLSLRGTGVTEAGLSVLQRMPSLENLDLSRPPFNSENIGSLRGRGIKIQLHMRFDRY